MTSPAWSSSVRRGAHVLLLCTTTFACRGGGEDARPVESQDSVIVSGLTDGALRLCADGPGRAVGTLTLHNPTSATAQYSLRGDVSLFPSGGIGTLSPNETLEITLSPYKLAGGALLTTIVEGQRPVRTMIEITVEVDVRVLRPVQVVEPTIGKSPGGITVENPTAYDVPVDILPGGPFQLRERVVLAPALGRQPGSPSAPAPGPSTHVRVNYELSTSASTQLGEDVSGELTLMGSRCSSKPLPEPHAIAVTGRSSDRATAIAAGAEHTCAIGARGALYCWGDNTYGQLGRASVPTLPAEFSHDALRVLDSDVTSVAAGRYHTCAVRSAAVSCWGANHAGQVDPLRSDELLFSPTAVALPAGARSVFAHGEATCAILEDETVACWGSDWAGNVGTLPARVEALADVEQVVIGESHRCARRHDGTVACWGLGGRVGDGTKSDRPLPVEVFVDAKQIAAGAAETCALAQAGTISCWGIDRDGKEATTPTAIAHLPASPVTGIFAGGEARCHSVANRTSCEGVGGASELLQPTAGATGGKHACVIHDGGKVACFGANHRGQLATPAYKRHGFD
ncbi:MAG: hypothetical protein J0I07_08880 [Myxococcales bacterium]|nr:hypothetical protein [Myxococcales bacterium]